MSMNPNKEEFYSFMDSLQLPRELNRDFLFDCLATAMEGGENLSAVNPRFSSFMINPAFLAMYLINEHIFYLSCHPEEKEADAIAKDGYRDILISVSLDKYYTNEHLAYQMGSFTSRFSPTLSTIDLYLNFILGMLSFGAPISIRWRSRGKTAFGRLLPGTRPNRRTPRILRRRLSRSTVCRRTAGFVPDKNFGCPSSRSGFRNWRSDNIIRKTVFYGRPRRCGRSFLFVRSFLRTTKKIVRQEGLLSDFRML